MRSLRDLLATWENWSARDTLGRASSDQARDALTRGLADVAEIDPLDALRDAAELVDLLQSWQWQAVEAARAGGATWAQVGAALRLSPAEAQSLLVGTKAALEAPRE